jgi:NAD(P)-dependent dehydrogenase (short-subunit alcohol dehydrogenase family)
MAMPGKLEGAVAIVTGAGSSRAGIGNGKAVAVRFAREGARVFAIDRNEAAVAETAALIQAEGGQVAAGIGDVSQREECLRLVAEARAAFGPVSVLHNNVGITGRPGDVEAIEEEAWRRVFAVNVDAMLYMTQAVLPQMRERGGGAIINVSTAESIRASSVPAVAYGASKGAVNSLTLVLAQRLGSHNIRVNALVLGFIDTPLVAPELDAPGARERLAARVPLGRLGSGWDVAGVAAFLASEDAAYVTGALIPVDGGALIQL